VKGNQLAGRFAVGIRQTGSKDEAYGVVSFTARTEIDKPNRLVTLEDLKIGKANFPTESAKEAEYLAVEFGKQNQTELSYGDFKANVPKTCASLRRHVSRFYDRGRRAERAERSTPLME